MKEPQDKRTKEYKEWVKKYGKLGDTLEKITEATGIKSIVKFIAGEDCGCPERKEKLNGYYRGANCLLEDEYTYLSNNIDRLANSSRITNEEMRKLLEIHDRVFNIKRVGQNCDSCSFRPKFKQLYTYFKKYGGL